MNAKAQRAEYKRRRTVAIKKLREAGMTEEEIREALAEMREELGISAETAKGFDSVANLPAVIDSADGHGGSRRLDREYSETPGRDKRNTSTIKENVAQYDSILEQNAERRCVATNAEGARCRKYAIPGGTVCRTHGGATRHVVSQARIRNEMASVKLMSKLHEIAFDDNRPASVQLDAIKDALNRSGLTKPTQVEVGPMTPQEQIFADIIGGSRDAYRNGSGFVEGLDDSPGIESREFDTGVTDYANYPDETSNARPSRGQDDPTRHPATWADGDSDPLSGPPAADQAGSRASTRARQSKGSEGPAPVTGEEAIRRANIANGLIDPEVFGLPPGRGY